MNMVRVGGLSLLLLSGCLVPAEELTDAGLSLDAGPRDAGIRDAGLPDSGTPDAGISDAGRILECEGKSEADCRASGCLPLFGQRSAFAPDSGVTIDSPSSVVFDGAGGPKRHVFEVLRTRSPARTLIRECITAAVGSVSCSFNPIDGAGAPSPTANPNLNVAGPITSLVWNGAIHLFYVDASGFDAVVRHGIFDGQSWSFSAVDGFGTPGAEVAAMSFLDPTNGKDWLFVAYQEQTSGHLRLAWSSPFSSSFGYQDHDGVSGSNGEITARVGQHVAFAKSEESIHLLYSDETNGGLRDARWTGGISAPWSFSTVDRQLTGAPAVVFKAGRFQTFAIDSVTGSLIRLTLSGSTWSRTVQAGPERYAISSRAVCDDGTKAQVFVVRTSDGSLNTFEGTGSGAWSAITTIDASGAVTQPACSPPVSGSNAGVVYLSGGALKLSLTGGRMAVIDAPPVAPTQSLPKEYAGCYAPQFQGAECQPLISCGLDVAASCWLFQDKCVPDGWERTQCDAQPGCPRAQ